MLLTSRVLGAVSPKPAGVLSLQQGSGAGRSGGGCPVAPTDFCTGAASPVLVPPSPVLVPPSMLHVLAAQIFKVVVGREGRNFTEVYKNQKETWHITAGGGLEREEDHVRVVMQKGS